MSVSSIPDAELLRRAITNARHPHKARAYRWNAVMHVFALGSTYARELCIRVGLDPDEMVKR